MPKTDQNPSPVDSDTYEAVHVHEVYEQIASHFSSTRYKPWPIVKRFLNELPDASIGLDIGCGNGKYLDVDPRIVIIGSDRSENLVRIASRRGSHSVVVADNLSLPHRSSSFDFAISIAVIHHLSTAARRVEAIRAILTTLQPSSSSSLLRETAGHAVDGGKALLFVWALEQKDSRRGWSEGDEQDVMVPWVMTQKDGSVGGEAAKTFQRYYHLYRRGELEQDIIEAGGSILEAGYERDNWWAIAVREPLQIHELS